MLNQNNNKSHTYLQMQFSISIVVILILSVLSVHSSITHLTQKNFVSKIQSKDNALVYVYSSSCNFCKQFTPIFQQLSQHPPLQNLSLLFAKMDGPAYQNFTHQMQVYSYPTIIFFKKGVPLPIIYRKQRSLKQLANFVLKNVNSTDDPSLLPLIKNMTKEQRVASKGALFQGKRQSLQFWAWDVISTRDGYIGWAFEEAQTNILHIGDRQVTDFSNLTKIQEIVSQVYARLHGVTQQAWLKMIQKQQFSIVYFNKHGSKKTTKLLSNIAKDIYWVHFIQIDGNHDEYNPALRALGLNNEQNIVAVDRKYDVMYIAPSPYSQENLKTFIEQARTHKLDPYKKTQKSQKPNKLTRSNYDEKMSQQKDILLFLYDKTQPISKQLMKLFQFLVQHLSQNKNLLLLRCDVKLNEVQDKLGFVIKPTPKLTFFRNRMRNHPIHFAGKTISAEEVINFIMENTTFDFQDSWAQL